MSASSDERLSRTIEGAFRLTLTESAGSDECVFLADLATELRSEGVSPPFAITADNLERVLFARLSTPQDAFPEGAWRRDPEAAPFAWLVRSYLRCFHASRKSASSKDLQEKQAALLAAANELCVSYCGLLLNPAMDGMFPQPEAAAARGHPTLHPTRAGCLRGAPRRPRRVPRTLHISTEAEKPARAASIDHWCISNGAKVVGEFA